MRRSLANALHVAGWIVLGGIPVSLLAPGCQGRECESDGFKDYGYGPGEGHLIDQNTWESTPSDDPNQPWLPFGPYHTWIFHPVGLEGRDLAMIIPYISADPDPNDPGKSATIGSGNGATFGVTSDSRNVFVTNSTCAPVYIRVVIVADPLPPGSSTGNDDGGVIDADTLDAGDGGD